MELDFNKVQSPGYSRAVFDPESFPALVEKMALKIEELRALHPEIEALACCGFSGLPLVGALSIRCKLPMIAVRKILDTTHSSFMVNGYFGAKGYLVIDDLISSGRTVAHTVHQIEKDFSRNFAAWTGMVPPKFVGCLLYENSVNYAQWVHCEGRRYAARCWGLQHSGLELDLSGTNEELLVELGVKPKLRLVPDPINDIKDRS